ncbi:MAG: hypothetical protein AAF961_00285 [Planctomycetota bacterium]
MAEVIRFHPLVAEDLAAATSWYDGISLEWDRRFRSAVDGCFDAI